jgi:hypothetical protein
MVFANPLNSHPGRPWSLAGTAVQLALYCLLVGTLWNPSSAQTVQGLPAVGTGSSQLSSQMLIDATAFSGAADMCASVIAACQKLGTTGYPQGATIDARGFTGDRVCAPDNATQMLNGCAASGGKLLLGTVHIFADGPASGVTGHYNDGRGSGVGTPAFVIPNQFWGIEGVSRGSSGSLGTWLSVCTGSGTPVTGCHNSFPVRSFTANSASVTGNIMTINVTPAANFAGPNPNIYAGELVMMKGNILAPSENGTYKVQNISGSTIVVTVPSGTASCTPPTGTCATLYLGTPILGFGPGNGNAYNTLTCDPQNNNPCSTFGVHITNLGFNCRGGGTQPTGDIEGCIGWQNLYAQEESGADTFLITNYNFVGFDSHGNTAQNFGPILNAEIYTGDSNSNCDFGTTGGYIEGIAMRGFDNWTINTPVATGTPSSTNCGNIPRAALMLDAQGTETQHGHCENFADCVLLGANNAKASNLKVNGIVQGKPKVNAVEISNNNPGLTDFVIENVQNFNGVTAATVRDDINGVTLSSPFVSFYSWSSAGNGFVNLVTTDTNTPSRFPTGIATGLAPTSGAPTNTDLAGQCTMGINCVGVLGTTKYSFRHAYANPPICTCTDVKTTGASTCNLAVTSTTITFTGTTTHPIDYICVSTN